jgi:hypothetical protein
MPIDRAGKRVRCPGCKSIISLPELSDRQKLAGGTVRLKAALALSNSIDRNLFLSINPDGLESLAKDEELKSEIAQPNVSEDSSTSVSTSNEGRSIQVEIHRESRLPSSKPVIDQNFATISAAAATTGSTSILVQKSWIKRLQNANVERITMARILGLLVFAVAVVNALPAMIGGFRSDPMGDLDIVPRWMYLQWFVLGVLSLYGILIFQVPHWSTLRAISIAMLTIAFSFGLVSTGLLIENGHGTVTNFLALSQLTVRRATLWCALMLCLATVVAMVCGKEAADWRRAEQLLVEILGRGA